MKTLLMTSTSVYRVMHTAANKKNYHNNQSAHEMYLKGSSSLRASS